jgi:glycosyltransferase involved in cell wall biosynthesis
MNKKFLKKANIHGNLRIDSDILVIVTTYNHEKYISECIDSILNQKYAKIHIIVHDDFSKDQTANIVKKIQQRKPSKVTFIEQKENQFEKGVNIIPQIILNTESKYIAFLDGDDCFSDELKISKQKKILMHDKKCSLVFTDLEFSGSNIKKINEAKLWYEMNLTRHIYTSDDLIKNNYFPKSSIMFRRSDLRLEFISKIKKMPYSDWLMSAQLLEKGYARLINKKMIKYRFHENNQYALKKDPKRIESEIRRTIFFKARYIIGEQKKIYRRYYLELLIAKLKFDLMQQNNFDFLHLCKTNSRKSK